MEPDGRRRIEDPWAVGFAIYRAADAVLPVLKVMNIHLSRRQNWHRALKKEKGRRTGKKYTRLGPRQEDPVGDLRQKMIMEERIVLFSIRLHR